jgi:hemoglobin/transferrin/lactoferrin receptor protein
MKENIIALMTISAFHLTAAAQIIQKDSLSQYILRGIVVSPTLYPQSLNKIPQQVVKINSWEIKNAQASNTADLLQQSGNVFIQKSQQGGGSVTLRGLEANRNVLVIDGVRMNNLIYRGGHLQNVITTDVNALENVEVLFGPSSSMFGSDAMGGVIYLSTKKPIFNSSSTSSMIKVNTQSRFTSANRGFSQHFDVNFGTKNWASWTSFSYSQFGDLRGGKNQNPFFKEDYGLRPYYVARINGKDSLMVNEDPTLQKNSQYTQYDFIQKLSYKTNDQNVHTLNYQFSNSGNVPRYDRLTDPTDTGLKYAEWYYGPQTRNMISYAYQHSFPSGLFKTFDLNANHQSIEESRHTRKFGNDVRQSRTENVSIQGLNASLYHESKLHQWRIGIDLQNNNLQSTAIGTNLVTHELSKLDTRYPNGHNNMRSAALYSSHQYAINSWLTFSDGLRVGYTQLYSTMNDFYAFANTANGIVNQNNPTYSGSVGLNANFKNQLNTSFILASGYRVPNVDDLSKIFETAAGGVIIPNNQLQPERSLTYEWNIRKVFDNVIAIENSAYYTQLKNMVVTDAFQLNGQDSVLYDGQMSPVLANQNKGKAFIYGNSTQIKANLGSHWYTSVSANYTYGRIVEQKNGIDSLSPSDHIPPFFAKWTLTYMHQKIKADFYVDYQGWKRYSDYRLDAEDNETYTPQNDKGEHTVGMPAWYTLNARVQYAFSSLATVQFGIENILDTQYRTFASGINGAGRNLNIAFNFHF